MSLQDLVRQKYEAALQSGDLLYFEGSQVKKESGGMQFEITYAPSLAQKPRLENPDDISEEKKKPKVNPFLSPNPALLVQELDEHRILLNKFCVVPYHTLVVTKDYRMQSEPLFPNDLLVAWKCLTTAYGSTPGVVFYNCGPQSGASQPHKHLQVVALQGDGSRPPIMALFNQIQERKAGQIYTLNQLPFVHVITPLDRYFMDSSADEQLGDYLAQMFFGLLDAMFQQLRKHATPSNEMSYNFIMTQQFMMLVPRSKELGTITHNGQDVVLSINSLGFAGLLLVKTEQELEAVEKSADLMALLTQVGHPWTHNDDDDEMEQ